MSFEEEIKKSCHDHCIKRETMRDDEEWNKVSDAYFAAARWGYDRGLILAAKEAHSQARVYFSNMEGQSEPEFGQQEFAMSACNYVSKRILALRTKK